MNAGIATVYQDLAVVSLMPVWRNFFLGNELRKKNILRSLDINGMRATTISELQKMGIDLPDVDAPIGSLSGGQRQCVAIARAIFFGARVLILDEPTAALGVKQSGMVLRYITAAKDQGFGVIFITHNPHHAYMVGDHFILLNRGRQKLDCTYDEISLETLTQEMAGGNELKALSHELGRKSTPAERGSCARKFPQKRAQGPRSWRFQGRSAGSGACAARSRAASCPGGAPNMRRYSRVNCDALS